MTTHFTTPCFCRVKDADKRKEICGQLERIGYKLLFSARHGHCGDIISVQRCGSAIATEVLSSDDLESSHDCGTNTELFLALASMRSDTDYMQWFTDGYRARFDLHYCEVESIESDYNHTGDMYTSYDYTEWRKATAAEIIEYFKK